MGGPNQISNNVQLLNSESSNTPLWKNALWLGTTHHMYVVSGKSSGYRKIFIIVKTGICELEYSQRILDGLFSTLLVV